MLDKLSCQYSQDCSGCPQIQLSLKEQQKAKVFQVRQELKDLLTFEPSWVSCGLDANRDRADMTYIGGLENKFGLYHKNKHEILDLEACPLQSPALANWYKEFRGIKFPIEFGSFRLRVGPQGQKGVWLDFSHKSVKQLFDDKEALSKLLNMAHVEIGQRRKVLKLIDGELKLQKPEPRVWFQTYTAADLKPLDLSCSLGDFTQPSMASNKKMVAEVSCQLKGLDIQTVAEVGAGIGNFSLMLGECFSSVDSFELDKNNFNSLMVNIERHGFSDKINAIRGDVFKYYNFESMVPDLLFVDPPRSGFYNFFEKLLTFEKYPKYIAYISCFPQSYAADLRLLKDHYRLSKMSLVDQFPHSNHIEIVSLLTKN